MGMRERDRESEQLRLMVNTEETGKATGSNLGLVSCRRGCSPNKTMT